MRPALYPSLFQQGLLLVKSLGPAAWFRYGQGIATSSGNVTLWDDAAGTERFLRCPGVSNNFASASDSAANSPTTEADIRIRLSCDDWSPAGTSDLLSKDSGTGSGNRCYGFRINASGVLSWHYAPDGGDTIRAIGSSTGVTFTDGTVHWVRVTYLASSGTVRFYTSEDGVTWEQLGTDRSVTAGNIFDGSNAIGVGANSAGSNVHAGRIYRAQIFSTIGGTSPVVDFYPERDAQSGATSFISATGETWTINQTSTAAPACIQRGNALKMGVDTNRPAKQSDGSILFDGVDNYLKTDAFTLNQPETVFLLGKQVTWTDGDLWCDGGSASVMQVRQSGVSPGISLDAGSVVANNNGLAVDTYGVVAAVFNGASSSLQINHGTPTTGNPGAGNAGGFTLGARGDGGALFGNIQVAEAIIVPAALDDDTRAKVIAYLNLIRAGLA